MDIDTSEFLDEKKGRSRADAFFDRRVSTWTDGCDRSIATVDRAIGAIGARSGRE